MRFISFIFIVFSSFGFSQNGLFSVGLDESEQVLIDYDGNFVSKKTFDSTSQHYGYTIAYCKDKALVFYGVKLVQRCSKKEQPRLLRTNGETFSGYFYVVRRDNKDALFDASGKMVMDYYEDSIVRVSHDNLVLYNKGNICRTIDGKEFKIKFENLYYDDLFSQTRMSLYNLDTSKYKFIHPIDNGRLYHCYKRFENMEVNGNQVVLVDYDLYDVKKDTIYHEYIDYYKDKKRCVTSSKEGVFLKNKNLDTVFYHSEENHNLTSVLYGPFFREETSDLKGNRLISLDGEVLFSGDYNYGGIHPSEYNYAICIHRRHIMEYPPQTVNEKQILDIKKTQLKPYEFVSIFFTDALKFINIYQEEEKRFYVYKLDQEYDITDTLDINLHFFNQNGNFIIDSDTLIYLDGAKRFNLPNKKLLSYWHQKIVMFKEEDSSLLLNTTSNKIIYSNFTDGTTEKLQAWLDSL